MPDTTMPLPTGRAAMMHLSNLLPVVPLLPLWLWLSMKDSHPYLDHHGREAVRLHFAIWGWFSMILLIMFGPAIFNFFVPGLAALNQAVGINLLKVMSVALLIYAAAMWGWVPAILLVVFGFAIADLFMQAPIPADFTVISQALGIGLFKTMGVVLVTYVIAAAIKALDHVPYAYPSLLCFSSPRKKIYMDWLNEQQAA